MKYIGIDIGGTKCAVTSGDAGGRVLEKIFFATTGVEETLHNIFEAVGSLGECDAIGISCGGPLDGERGIILSPPNLPGWDKIRITDMLKERFKVPAFLQNDADACALAEWKFGAGKGADIIVAAHLFWLQINLIDCHRINRYNDISIEKEKVPEHLFFCRDKCSGTIYKHGYYIKIRNRIQ